MDYIVKPVDPNILRAKVKFCLNLHIARRAAEIARLEAESAQRRALFLAQASAVLSESLDYSTTLARIANLAVPAVADWCMVTLVQDNKSVRRVAVVHRDARKQDLARDYEKRFPPISHGAGEYATVLREGKAVLVPEVDDSQLVAAAQSTEHLQLLRELGVSSCIMAPLLAHQTVLGVISFMLAESNRRYGPADLTLAQDLAIRAALAIENAQLYEAERKRADFEQTLIGIVSHDLRNPLGVIKVSAAAIERGIDIHERHKKVASRIVSATERASRLIRDLLDFTQARMAGGIPIQRRAVDFHVLTKESLEGIRHTHDGRNIELEQSGDGEGEWDPDRIDQVLENLVNNALKYSPPGSAIDVETKGQNAFMLLQVHNAGDPIPQELLPDIFKPMNRGPRKMDKGSRSIGLGLYIVQQIVLAHDGVIEVSSSREKGTTFTVRLPRKAQSGTIELKERVGPTIQSHSSEGDREQGVLH